MPGTFEDPEEVNPLTGLTLEEEFERKQADKIFANMESKESRDLSAEELSIEMLGVNIETFLNNIDKYIGELTVLIRDRNIENLIAASKIYLTICKALEADEVVLSEETHDKLVHVKAIYDEARAKSIERDQADQLKRDQEWIAKRQKR